MTTKKARKPAWTVMLSGDLVRVLTFDTFAQVKQVLRDFRNTDMSSVPVGCYLVFDHDGDLILDSEYLGISFGYESARGICPLPGVYTFDSENDVYVPFDSTGKGGDRIAA